MDASESFAAHADKAVRRRSPLQFTVRSLLVLTALVAAFFGGRATMMPQLEVERAKAREAELARANEPKWLAELRDQVAKANPQPTPVRIVVPVRQPADLPSLGDRFQGRDRAERANLWEHQRRWETQGQEIPRQEWRSDGPPRGLQYRSSDRP